MLLKSMYEDVISCEWWLRGEEAMIVGYGLHRQ
jgi:hypothetical protein